MNKILIKKVNVHHRLKQIKKTKEIIATVFDTESVEYQNVMFIFCFDSYLKRINKSFLNHNYLTDVITFNLSDDSKINGEIYISVERIKENSKNYKVSYLEEARRVMIHGVLHLCGYNDTTNAQKKEMTEKENFYLLNF